MRYEIIIAVYCLVALFPLCSRWVFNADSTWLWFINDLSYGLRVVVLASPLFVGIARRAKDLFDYTLLILFGFLLLSNITVILSDYKFVDSYDAIVSQPRLVVTIIVMLFSVYQLKKE